jgi:flagellar biosynthetic protein FliQ
MDEVAAARGAIPASRRIWPAGSLPADGAGDTQGWVSHMDTGHAVDLVRHSLIMALTVSAPMLLIGLVVGIVISLLQAVTQIQEQTLSFIPKIVAMVAAAIALAPWTAQRLMDYSREMFTSGIMN